MDDEHQHNGLITKIWGPPTWVNFHCVSFGYPIEPTPEQKAQYKQYYTSVGDTLPCRHCRDSYRKFITTGCTALTDAVMENRRSLTFWAYCIHEAVNKKLGVNYGVTYEDVVRRYESYRARCSKNKNEKGCITPLDKKSQSYLIAAKKDCPIISQDIVDQFKQYAQNRGVQVSNADSEERRQFCLSKIDNMRKQGVQSIETMGPFEGLPTTDELELIMRRSSNLANDELLGCISKLPKTGIVYSRRKMYKLKK